MANCNGPAGDKWDGTQCVGTSAQTSCDSVAQETCYYAFQLDSGGKSIYFSGRFAASQGLKVAEAGLLANIGISAGDWINKVNGVLLTDEETLIAELAPFTESDPAQVASQTHLLGKFQLELSHS